MRVTETATLRILDAAANRASEGLRVVEDYLRFALDDRFLTETCKQLRHELGDLIACLPDGVRYAARDTQADIGRDVSCASESVRSDMAAVLAASFQRTQQALRSMEEYGKLVNPQFAAAAEALRYRSYVLEKAAAISQSSLKRLSECRLYVIIDGRGSSDDFAALVRQLVEAEVDVLQLRDKGLNDRPLVERARALRQLTRDTQTLVVVNDRADVARVVDADGVHVGQDELTVKEVRTVIGPQSLVGVSAHSVEQARAAVLDGASYIGVGPTFPSATKQFESFGGLALLRAVTAEVGLPAFAIGGIKFENIDALLQTGIERVAIGHAIVNAADPKAAAVEFKRRLMR
jgi:thiamine-phosphate pyrophosphorylase